jgi:hypothetical protein
MKQTFVLSSSQAKQRAAQAVIAAGPNWIVSISEPRRSLQQNALMWSLLGELAEQLEWHGQKLTAENWKDMCTAALKRQQVVPGIDGGFVVLGTSTRKMTKVEMNELIEFIYAFGTEHGVHFAEASYEDHP